MHPLPSLAGSMRHPFKRQLDRDDPGPAHPGEVLREDFLPYHRLTESELARRLEVAPDVVTQLLAERTAVTDDLAERLAATFALPTRYWLALQLQYDLWHDLASQRDA